MVLTAGVFAQSDTAHLLKKVTVKGLKRQSSFASPAPSQSLSDEALRQLNAPTVGDAARFFSGVQVKDYGGIGGLKTISVRSLGASHTGILYDGIPVSDVQTGQIDLSRYSSNSVYALELFQGNPTNLLTPAKGFASAAVLAMQTRGYYPALTEKAFLQTTLRQGSFGLWQASGATGFRIAPKTTMQLFTEGLTSKGDYPITIKNGNLVEKTRRLNGKINSFQGEADLTHLFRDSSLLQVKGWAYLSDRGLPGAITNFNNRSVQQLYNRDYFGQLRYSKQFHGGMSLQAAGKYNYSYTRYRDPDFLNTTGGLDDRYRQQETYFSIVTAKNIGNAFSVSLAEDVAFNALRANKANFPRPARFSNWSNFAANYHDSLWQLQASLLWSFFSDKTETGRSGVDRNKFTPTVVVRRRIGDMSPFSVRLFYKEVYRMPTFNDLYYNFIGNTNLRPEFARQYNAGVVYSKNWQSSLRRINISVDGYVNRIKDKIIAIPAQNLFSWTMLNLGKVDVKGVDLTAEAAGAVGNVQWSARAAYTYQHAIDITDPSGAKYRNRIPYTPDHSGSGFVSLGYKQWQCGYSLVFSGTRYALGENNPANQLEGWGTHDVFVSRFIPLGAIKADVKFELNNLSDQQYDIIRNYPMPGRSYKISLNINYQNL